MVSSSDSAPVLARLGVDADPTYLQRCSSPHVDTLYRTFNANRMFCCSTVVIRRTGRRAQGCWTGLLLALHKSRQAK